MKEKAFGALRKKLLGGAAAFYTKLETMLRNQSDRSSRAALGQAYEELAHVAYDIESPAGAMWIYDFGLRVEAGQAFELDSLKARFQEAFRAAWNGQAEVDGLNALVVAAGLTWRQAVVLRAYARYLRQAGTSFSQAYIEQCILANVPLARMLVRLFEMRFDPAYAGDRDADTDKQREQVELALEGVEQPTHLDSLLVGVCRTYSSDSRVTDSAAAVTAQFTHAGGSPVAVSLVFPSRTCTIATGSYSQRGQFGRIGGAYTCTDGESGTSSLTELRLTVETLTFRYGLNGNGPSGACQLDGDFAGLRW